MEPEKKKPGACPPRAGLNPHFLHTAVLKGIAVFFVRQAFSFSLGLTHHPPKANSRARTPEGVRAFSMSGNADFCYFPLGQASRVAGGRRPSGFLPEIQTKRRYTAWTLVKRKYGFAANLSRSRTRYIPLICGATGKCATLRRI